MAAAQITTTFPRDNLDEYEADQYFHAFSNLDCVLSLEVFSLIIINDAHDLCSRISRFSGVISLTLQTTDFIFVNFALL